MQQAFQKAQHAVRYVCYQWQPNFEMNQYFMYKLPYPLGATEEVSVVAVMH